jgi:hypothetical protein
LCTSFMDIYYRDKKVVGVFVRFRAASPQQRGARAPGAATAGDTTMFSVFESAT